jgi:DNA-binding MarR family transcriptional regulator
MNLYLEYTARQARSKDHLAEFLILHFAHKSPGVIEEQIGTAIVRSTGGAARAPHWARGFSQGALSKTISKLLVAGYLEGRLSLTGRRRRYLTITEAGRAWLRGLARAVGTQLLEEIGWKESIFSLCCQESGEDADFVRSIDEMRRAAARAFNQESRRIAHDVLCKLDYRTRRRLETQVMAARQARNPGDAAIDARPLLEGITRQDWTTLLSLDEVIQGKFLFAKSAVPTKRCHNAVGSASRSPKPASKVGARP